MLQQKALLGAESKQQTTLLLPAALWERQSFVWKIPFASIREKQNDASQESLFHRSEAQD